MIWCVLYLNALAVAGTIRDPIPGSTSAIDWTQPSIVVFVCFVLGFMVLAIIWAATRPERRQ